MINDLFTAGAGASLSLSQQQHSTRLIDFEWKRTTAMLDGGMIEINIYKKKRKRGGVNTGCERRTSLMD
jgi:hypothetical protein